MIFGIKREFEDIEVAGPMLGFGDARADDGRSDCRMFQHPATGDVGKRNAVLFSNGVGGRQQRLERIPTAGGIDEALVFHAAPVGDLLRLRLAQPFFGNEAAAKGCRRPAA